MLQTANLGGAELLAVRIVQALRGRFQFVVACFEENGPILDRFGQAGAAVWPYPKARGLDTRLLKGLRRFLGSQRVILIHAHQCGPFLYAGLARLPSTRPPILLTEHGRQHPDMVKTTRRIANRLLLRRADRLIAVGSQVRRALIDNENFPPGRVGVIYNGIDLAAFDAARSARDATRAELRLRPSTFVLIVCARLDPIKDHATTLQAFRWLLLRVPDARLLIVGDGPERDAIDSIVRQLDLDDAVIQLGHRNDVPRLLAASDAAILTSLSEGIPLFLIEAMASSLPVVATSAGGIPEVVVHGRTGLLADVGDVNGLGNHLLELAQRPELRAAMGAAGRARAEAVFDESRMIAAYAAIYEHMSGFRSPALPDLSESDSPCVASRA
jgi:glycosyltransferase involved in cell wall biosynthesis